MHEHVPPFLTEHLSLEEEKDVRLYLLEELKGIIKKYALYYASHEEEPTPQAFFLWIETLGEGETYPSGERFDEQVLAHDVRRFEKLYKELANIALKKPIAKETVEGHEEWYKTEIERRLHVFDEKTLDYIEYLVGEKGVNTESILLGLTGVDSDRAWKMRNQLLAKDVNRNLVKISLAGIDSEQAWEVRDRFLLQNGVSYPSYTAQSLVGIDSERAWEMRAWLQDGNSIIASIVGLDSQRAWNFREQHLLLGDGYSKSRTIESLAGLDSEKAWEMRERIFGTGVDVHYMARSLAGLDSDRAWKMRDELLKNEMSKRSVVRSLAGVDSERAWEMREQFLVKGKNKKCVAESLVGVNSEQAWKFREQFLKEGFKDFVALSLAGNSTTFVWRLIAKAKHRKK